MKLISYSDKEREIVEAIIKRLPEFKYQRGGSHFFTGETLFRPIWMTGYYIHEVQIVFFYHIHDYGEVESHLKIEGRTTGGDWERFYEGGCDEFEDFENIIRLLKFEI